MASQNEKDLQLDEARKDNLGKAMTTNEGVKIEEDHFSLRAGTRGPTLLQDFHLHEKLMHFDRERIPERVVHARGTGAHGVFVAYDGASKYTSADFLSEEGKETPVFVRFSTTQGFRGSPDTVRDVRGFAVKFYTQEGNYDFVGVSIPAFFIQDAIKFPDLIHALKPEPRTEVPQGQTAHDSFWDFVGNNHETANAMFFAMSDRGIPRSYRMMEGFGIHTFKWINADGDVHFVRLHMKPVYGLRQMAWDECLKICGKDPDFHRKDLMEAIDNGDYPAWEFGIQAIAEKDEFMFDFDILDSTKFWPEEIVPVTPVGKWTLTRNVDNFFSETEQAAFAPANIVPGMAFSSDPLLQGRIFSYMDTHVHRLGTANFQNIPINRPVAEVANNQRDGFSRYDINTNLTNYDRNMRDNNDPHVAEDGFEHHREALAGNIGRSRPKAFTDFYTQPALHYHSLTTPEQEHLKSAIKFELTKVSSQEVRERIFMLLSRIDMEIAKDVAGYFNCEVKEVETVEDHSIGDAKDDYTYKGEKVDKSPALRMDQKAETYNTMKIGVFLGEKLSEENEALLKALEKEGFYFMLFANNIGTIKDWNGEERMIDEAYNTGDGVLVDALYIAHLDDLHKDFQVDARHFIEDAFGHGKPILVAKDQKKHVPEGIQGEGVVFDATKDDALEALAGLRYWNR